jgi:hypothetical protein
MKSNSGSPAAAEAIYAEISYWLDVCRVNERARVQI